MLRYYQDVDPAVTFHHWYAGLGFAFIQTRDTSLKKIATNDFVVV
jgi:hypothetical protein